MRGKQLKNKPILTRDTGEKAYRIDNLIFDAKKGKIVGLLAESGSLISKAKVVPFSEIEAIGPDAVTVRSTESIKTADETPDIKPLVDTDFDIRERQIFSEDGKDLGEIDDFDFNEQTGEIKGYYVTGGVLSDVYKGKPFLPTGKIEQVGKDVIFVPTEVVDQVMEHEGGLKKAYHQAEDRTKAATANIKGGAKTQTERAKGYVEEGEFGEKAKSTWDDVKSTTKQWFGQAQDKYEGKKIERALGRPATRVILDRSDKVILNTGDLITHKAIDRAKEEGALDILLSSVDTEKPDIPEDQKRA